ncbi:D-2-hydroxyacid dehydrogenase family protein [Pseudolabrys taiwanensis]|uniref:D-2-hydroxyacid dehydrogenase family protein n=1 Tax=Pseudolabrys taiwanensis TaxID=331696 RepID=A0A345ZWJ1_9HYPH|nr:D-2-hydroxyacid dehydrogenase family protein [Pseudolabrys taiwanensis]AXK81288.1 D-2-hydroxyacid dehydrogenase family protein [Pseudolabrys taiwanensis]
MIKAAILDDYQNVALRYADWSPVAKDVEITVFNKPFASQADTIKALQGFAIVAGMRERTAFPRAVLEALPDLKLLITTGAKNNSFDVKAAAERGITVCGTGAVGNPTTGVVFGLMLELTRRIGFENARMKAGEPWQVTIGKDLEGQTLGIVGIGKLGQRVAAVAKAFGMNVIAWSQNLTPEKAAELGVGYATKEELFATADFITIHYQLSERSRGLITAADIGRMKNTAYLINTARAPIVDQAALLEALQNKKIAGAGLDVFEIEPLPIDHPYRKLDNVVLTPHLGYVSEQNYRKYYPDIVEDIRAWLDGKPVRVITP